MNNVYEKNGNPIFKRAFKKYFDFVLLIDKSGSTKDIIGKIQSAMITIVNILTNNKDTLNGVNTYLSIILFDGEQQKIVDKVLLINTIDAKKEGSKAGLQGVDIKTLKWEAGSFTDTGTALCDAISEYYDGRYDQWRVEGVEKYHPYFCLISDGYPDGGTSETMTEQEKKQRQEKVEETYRIAANRIKKLEKEGKLIFTAISVDHQDNVNKLRELTNDPNRVIHFDTTKNDCAEFEKTLEDLIQGTITYIDGTPLSQQIGEL